MTTNGGTINFLIKCHSINLNISKYILNVVLGVQWLQTLGTLSLNFLDFFHDIFLKRKGN